MSALAKDVRLKALIVDDEPLARGSMRVLLAEHAADHIVLEAKNGWEAVSLIRNQRPDLVFLDVQMPEMDGFEVVREIGMEIMPRVIFVTAHDQYAVRAFEICAFDYLLKPVSRGRFAGALARVHAHLRTHPVDIERIALLLETIASPRKRLSRLAIRSAGKTYFVALDDVAWLQAAENYVELRTGAARHLVHVRIHKLEECLDPETFMRIHRSLIVNKRYIQEVEPATHGEYVLTLRDGTRLKSSRTYDRNIRTWAANPF
jgi:two-component system, LytTR family, response regulator